ANLLGLTWRDNTRSSEQVATAACEARAATPMARDCASNMQRGMPWEVLEARLRGRANSAVSEGWHVRLAAPAVGSTPADGLSDTERDVPLPDRRLTQVWTIIGLGAVTPEP